MWKCKPAGWLYGLPLLALLWLLVIFGERRNVEADMVERVSTTLEDAGLGWAKADFSGRDGVLSGTADGIKDQDDAIALAEKTWGVRIVAEDMNILRTESPYTWSARKEENELVLNGFVPSRKDRKAVMNMARAQFPDIKIRDNMEIASGEPDHRTFMETVGFGLKQLSVFNYGRVGLRDRNFSIEGLTRDAESFQGLKQALREELPIDMRLSLNRVKAPDIVIPRVSPFLWSAQREDKHLRLSGHVHSARERTDILENARRLMPDLKIIDNMQIARGDPSERQWEDGTNYALSQLAKLEKGKVRLRNFDYSIEGNASNSSSLADVEDSLGNLPRGFRVDAKKLIAPKVSPYIWRADYHSKRLTLSGHVPDKKTRRTIKAQAKRSFPKAIILDKMKVGRGAPKNWSRVANYSLSQLSRLDDGSTMIWNKEIEMRGRATSARRRVDIQERMKGDLPRGYQFFDEIRMPEPVKKQPETFEQLPEITQYQEDDFQSSDPLQRDDCQSYLNTLLAGQRIHFATASASFKEDSYGVLNKLAHTAGRCPDTRIEIQGHTDSDGNRKFNEFLSLRRARSVVKYLINNGISKDRLSAIGYGEAKPVAPNDSKDNKAKNRRIEFKVKDF